MRAIVEEANAWCTRTISGRQLLSDTISQVKYYEEKLNEYVRERMTDDQWMKMKQLLVEETDDLVECRMPKTKR